MYVFFKLQASFTDLLTYRQPLLASLEWFLFAARRRHGERESFGGRRQQLPKR